MASVLVPLAEGCEELEAVTIMDLLVRAGIDVVSAGLADGPVRCSRGTTLIPGMTLDKAMERQFDMIVLPGGQPGATHLQEDPRIIKLLQDMSAKGHYTAAICAAPSVLARAELLEGKRFTSYPGAMGQLMIAGIKYVDDDVVVDGKVITSRGPGTAMDFSLALIEILSGKKKRDEVEASLMRPAAGMNPQ